MNQFIKSSFSTLGVGIFILLFAPKLVAAVSVSPLFGNHAIIQSGDNIPVWGTADEGEKVTVRFANQEATAVAIEGRWEVRFNGLKATISPCELTVVGSSNTVISTDILIGEVWLCSGQSNMVFNLGKVTPADQEEARSHPLLQLRNFNVKQAVSPLALKTVDGVWLIAEGNNLMGFTAVGYYFGRSIVETQHVAVGLISSYWGGSPAEAWTSDKALKSQPALEAIFVTHAKRIADFPKQMENYLKSKATYDEKLAEAKSAGNPLPTEPKAPRDPQSIFPNSPSLLYNGMLHPLIPVAMRGVIWYQGEANHQRSLEYQTLLPTMIADWRSDWGRGEFPFFMVQIAPFKGTNPLIREAQMKVCEKIKNTDLVCTLDVGEAEDIHPKNKRPVGERLALLARSKVYIEKVISSGPRFAKLKVSDNVATLSFNFTDGGLVATDAELKGFSVAGDNKTFVPAIAVIKGNKVEVSAAGILKPVAVRYAWESAPESSFSNGAGLPAFPFRTDDW